MDLRKRIKSALAWLTMAILCGLVGFMIVHHYATDWRPVERFAIVIDAGSTQTRSSLFRLTIKSDDFSRLGEEESADQVPISRMFKVQQIGSCVNGGPLASIQNRLAADELVRKCLIEFAEQIKMLDFNEGSESAGEEDADGSEARTNLTGDDVNKQLALMNHRVNSITHLHLGATAGMRALEQSNSTRADEKLGWIKQSIIDGNQMLAKNRPHVNAGYIGTLTGSDEASFGWVSVNFVCSALFANAPPLFPEFDQSSLDQPDNGLVYKLDANPPTPPKEEEHKIPNHFRLPHSIGTIELGGASAQLAFQVSNSIKRAQIRNISLEEQGLTLFNGHYKLATRSDLCLGMSQAVLRLNYVLLYKTIKSAPANAVQLEMTIANVCLHKGSVVKLSGGDLRKMWHGACLMPSDDLGLDSPLRHQQIREAAFNRTSVTFIGTGEVDKCDALLEEIVQPSLCRKYFSLCPHNIFPSQLPKNMPFVTISGYNHALKVLNLKPVEQAPESLFEGPSDWTVLDQAIEEQLGGLPVDYEQFVNQTRKYCSTDVSELTKNYPKVTRQYQNIICLQLVYIRKLLVEFYQIHPTTSWQQVKFLIFEQKKNVIQQQRKVPPAATTDIKPDIGWTLGLLLNATSYQLESDDRNDLYHHHGASPMYIVRATIFLVVGCSLIAIAFLVISAVQINNSNNEEDALPNSSRSTSCYDIGNLGYTISYPPNYNSINSAGQKEKMQPDKHSV